MQRYPYWAMPKAYSAPIPIYHKMGVDDRDFVPRKRYPWPDMTKERVERDWDQLVNFYDAIGDAPLADELHAIRDSPEWSWGDHIPSIEAKYVIEPMEGIRHLALWASVTFEDDVLDIDDAFLWYCNPRIENWIAGLKSAASTDNDDGAEYLKREVIMTDQYTLNPKRLRDITLRDKKALVCWHLGRHSQLRRRGRQWTPGRRAATWATYCFAWLTGSESTAVRLWNAYGHDIRWGTDDPSGIKKYGVAKRRLVGSLQWAMGAAVTPPNSWARPYDPLPDDVLAKVFEAIQSSREARNPMPISQPEPAIVGE